MRLGRGARWRFRGDAKVLEEELGRKECKWPRVALDEARRGEAMQKEAVEARRGPSFECVRANRVRRRGVCARQETDSEDQELVRFWGGSGGGEFLLQVARRRGGVLGESRRGGRRRSGG